MPNNASFPLTVIPMDYICIHEIHISRVNPNGSLDFVLLNKFKILENIQRQTPQEPLSSSDNLACLEVLRYFGFMDRNC